MNSVLPGLDALRAAANSDNAAGGRSNRVTAPRLNGVLHDVLAFLRSRRVGLVSNHTGRVLDGAPALAALRSLGVAVEALFSPEHGPQGTREGDIESGRTDDGLPIHSLYGDTRRPNEAMLRGLEALVFDIQDVGARFYTYGTTLAYCMEECAAHGLALVVLDRPNPLGGEIVEGPALCDECRSFVGHVRVPVCHGLTMGEFARLHQADTNLDLDLRIAPVSGWRRAMRWPETGLTWIAPSPNLPDFESAAWYPATCLLEFSGVSVGRGTDAPFQIVGAPWLDAAGLADAARGWPGLVRENVVCEAVDFTPGRATFSGELCHGIRLRAARTVADVPLAALGLTLLDALHRAHPAEFGAEKLRASLRLVGSPQAIQDIIDGRLENAIALANADAREFRAARAPFLMYA